MPKIEVPLKDFLALAELPDATGLEDALEPLKAELDGMSGGRVKIELNDTNRPDLWTTEGIARGLRCYRRERAEAHLADLGSPGRHIDVSEGLSEIRPFIAAFTATGWTVDEEGLEALITAQEKLAASFGKERRTAAIGFYSLENICFPVDYTTASPERVFHPLGEEEEMSLARVLEKTEAGVKYAGLLRGQREYPILQDASGSVLSFPPVLNSHTTGRVEPGQSALFCEVTGTDRQTVNLTATILACNLEDRGAVIEPVEIRYPRGASEVTPVVFRDTLTASFRDISSITGERAEDLQLEKLLSKMDYGEISLSSDSVTAVMPPTEGTASTPRTLSRTLP